VRREHPEIAVREFRPEPSEALDLMRAGFRPESLIDTWKLGFAGAARTLRRDAAALAVSLGPLGVALEPSALDAAAARFGVEIPA
jgi:hypothetical protein